MRDPQKKKEPKKELILFILDIMRRHTDKNHTLSQHRIQELVQSESGMDIDRKTVRRNLSKLMEIGYPIRFQGSDDDAEEITRIGKNGAKQTIRTNWYYDHEFENGELSFLIDSVLLADGLPKKHRQDLIRKLEALTSRHFRSVTSKVDMNIYGRPVNAELLLTVETIRQAVTDKRQMRFRYCETGMDCKLHLRTDENRKPREYTANPYQIIAMNGHQYLVCHLPQHGHDDLTHFRVDRIKDSAVLDTPALPIRELRGFENGLQLSEYVKAHPNLWSGQTVHVTFRCGKNMMNDIVDSFGTELHIEPQPDDRILVHVYAGEEDMRLWAVRFADAVEVLSPQSLRERIRETLRGALEKYKG